jgi:hypothetical protein
LPFEQSTKFDLNLKTAKGVRASRTRYESCRYLFFSYKIADDLVWNPYARHITCYAKENFACPEFRLLYHTGRHVCGQPQAYWAASATNFEQF